MVICHSPAARTIVPAHAFLASSSDGRPAYTRQVLSGRSFWRGVFRVSTVRSKRRPRARENVSLPRMANVRGAGLISPDARKRFILGGSLIVLLPLVGAVLYTFASL